MSDPSTEPDDGPDEVSARAAPERADPELDAAAEAVENDLASLGRERDEYLALAQRLQAEFENFKKQAVRRNTEVLESAASRLAEKLLPVLDACDAALAHGHDDVKPIYDALMDVLEKEGLTVEYPAGAPFDPNRHEAVLHEPADGDGEPEVVEVLRSGYLWKGRVLRPAMVKVKG